MPSMALARRPVFIGVRQVCAALFKRAAGATRAAAWQTVLKEGGGVPPPSSRALRLRSGQAESRDLGGRAARDKCLVPPARPGPSTHARDDERRPRRSLNASLGFVDGPQGRQQGRPSQIRCRTGALACPRGPARATGEGACPHWSKRVVNARHRNGDGAQGGSKAAALRGL